MKKLTHTEMIDMTVLTSREPVNKKVVEATLNAYVRNVKQCLMEGLSITVPLLGTFYPREKKPYKGRKYWDIHDKEIKTIDIPPHNVPIFKPSQTLIRDMKNKTWGEPF